MMFRPILSADGKLLATPGLRNEKTAQVWDIGSGKLLTTFAHEKTIYEVAFSPDGSRLACGDQGGSRPRGRCDAGGVHS